MTQPLSVDLIRQQLNTKTFGQQVVYVPQTGSTNDDLKKQAQAGAVEGLLYITDEQVSGRGRLQRSWHAPAGSSLLMSLLFRPGGRVKPHQVQRLTMLSALSLADAIESETGLVVPLKWPNDLVWTDGKKLAGILTELEADQEQTKWSVVGIGLNVNVDFSQHQPSSPEETELDQIATSLATILRYEVDRQPILQQFLRNVEQRYEALHQGHVPHQEWAERLVSIGQQVTVTNMDGSKKSGLITGVDENGALQLEQADGSVVTVWAGEVTLRH